MKLTHFSIQHLAILALAASLGTQAVAQTTLPTNFQPPVLENRAPLFFPQRLTNEGVFSGVVTVQVAVDEQGTVEDWLPLATTHEGFIEQLGPIDKWEFRPATRDGTPVPSALILELRFEKGSVVSMTVNEMASSFLNTVTNRYSTLKSRVSRISELDALPKPITIVNPPSSVPEGSKGGSVVVSFYIDEQGRVRLPLLSDIQCDDALAAAAYNAVTQWRFDAPTVRGRPVIVRAEQKFIFKPQEAQASAAE